MRDNETTRVAAVLAHLDAGNLQAAIDALMHLWMLMPERDGIDVAAVDAWQAIDKAGAIPAALEAVFALMRGGTKIRPHAFIDVTERASEEQLDELVDLAISGHWSVDPYVAAVMLRFAERNLGAAFDRVLDRHQRFHTDDAAWQLVLYIMSTSRIGNRAALARWFADWQQHRGIAMWAVSAYLATGFDGPTPAYVGGATLKRMVEVAREACTTLAWDDSAAFFVCLKMVGDIQNDRWTEFVATMAEHREMIVAATKASRLDHPIVKFANRLKHAHPVIGLQLDNPRAQLPDATDPRDRLINRQLAEVVVDLSTALDALLPALDLFHDMLQLPHGDPHIIELVKQMTDHDLRGAGGWFRTAWQRLIRQRASWRQKLRLALVPL